MAATSQRGGWGSQHQATRRRSEPTAVGFGGAPRNDPTQSYAVVGGVREPRPDEFASTVPPPPVAPRSDATPHEIPNATPRHDTPYLLERHDGSRSQPIALVAFQHAVGTRYEVGRVLFRNENGVVLEARDRALGRWVVVQLLSRELVGDALAATQLVSAGRMASRVQHPSIVALLELGVLETGEPYVVTEHCAGHDLATCLSAWGPLSLTQALGLLAPIAVGLDALHAAHVVHRDLRPANVAVLEGSGPPAKVIDLSLALVDPDAYGRAVQRWVRAGEAEHVAPEVLAGAMPSASADVYALGCLAYRMLAGRGPFEGDGARDTMRLPPHRLDTLGIASASVANAVERALAPDPWRRPGRASDLVAELATELRRPDPARMAVAPPAPRSIVDPVRLPVDGTWLRGAMAVLALLAALLVALAFALR